MKILAIRGENLASLKKFEVDFETEPLRHAGVFAIAGPTGAGKSTLLDAMCLALFDTTPRLETAGKVEIGIVHEGKNLKVKEDDPRSLLRRGAGEGFAEVDFRDRTGTRWRARWSIHRERRKPGGALQKQSVTLTSLETGAAAGSHRKEETLDIIAEKIGLTFHQFTRSALLAQGEFAQFLKAEEKDRARLLEKMTGTEIYKLLSREAFQRAKTERENLTRLTKSKADGKDYAVLFRHELEELNQLQVQLAAERDRQQAEKNQMQHQLAWYDRRTTLETELQTALSELDHRQAEWNQLADLRLRIAAIERIQPLRSVVKLTGQKRRDIQRAKQAAAQFQQAIEMAAGRHRAAQTLEHLARQRLDLALANRHNAATELEIAKALDIKLEQARQQFNELQAAHHRQTTSLQAKEREVQHTQSELHHLEAEARETEQWLEQHLRLQLLAEQWPRWNQEFQAFESARVSQSQLEKDLSQSATKLAAAHDRLNQTRARLAEKKAALSELDKSLHHQETELESHERQFPPAEQHRWRKSLEELRRTLLELEKTGHHAAASRNEADHELDEANAARAQVKQAQREGATALQNLEELRQKLFELSRRIARARAREDYAVQRPELLAAGEPCPLCGSLEHPWADETHPPSNVLRSLEREAEHQENRCQEIQKLLSAHQANQEASKKLAELHQKNHQRALADSEEAIRQWQRTLKTVLTQLEELPFAETGHIIRLLRAATVETSLGAAFETIAGLLQVIENHEQERADLRTRLDRLRREQSRLVADLNSLQPNLDRQLHEVQSLETSQLEFQHTLKQHQNRAQEALERLAPAFQSDPEWTSGFIADASRFHTTCHREVEQWNRYQTELKRVAERKTALQQQSAVLATELKGAQEAVRQIETKLNRQTETVDHLHQERQALLQGKSVAEVSGELNLFVQTEEQHYRTAQTALQTAVQESLVAETNLHNATRQIASCETAYQTQRQELEQALNRFELPGLTDLCQQLAFKETRLRTEQARIAALQQEIQRIAAIRDNRRSQLEEHLTRTPSVGSPETLRKNLAKIEQDSTKLSEQLGANQEKLRTDAENRRRLAGLEKEIEAQQQVTQVWEELRDLIGSADGDKFQKYAQSLTLELLLDHANHHLSQLRPRYRLERVPGYDLEIHVVDRDLGDEIRSCASLSGGETFLISLALALGLSSVSARQVTIESLFIDEGFGTLDRDSLETAVAALDQLQAEGCQVGIISHIPDLAERLGYQILVEPRGAGISTVSILGKNS
ncbi:MAG: AAA family ATPase [Blastocatellia bacterium]|nr:AAA family ATPase [Blastocatellia bacterium]